MRAVIVCGAKIKDYEFVSSHFKAGDYFIYCDSGLMHEDRFLSPVDTAAALIIGDFDSHEKPVRDTEIIELPREKDDTDSVYALKEAIKRGYDEILIVGCVGDRLDHTLVNVYALMYAYEQGINAVIADDYSEMCLIGPQGSAFVEDRWDYFSLVAVAGAACGVKIDGAKYCLDGGVITPSYQYATSNEPLAGGARVSVDEGYLLVIKVRE